MKLFRLLLLLILAGSVGCQEKQKTPAQLKQELLFSEMAEAKKYVKIENAKMTEDNHLFKKDEVVVTGTVISTASVAKFKDIKYQVVFYSKTNTRIDQKDFVIYEFLQPGGTLQLNARMIPPKAYESFNVFITDVKPG